MAGAGLVIAALPEPLDGFVQPPPQHRLLVRVSAPGAELAEEGIARHARISVESDVRDGGADPRIDGEHQHGAPVARLGRHADGASQVAVIAIQRLERADRIRGATHRRRRPIAIRQGRAQEAPREGERASEVDRLHSLERKEVDAETDAAGRREGGVDTDVLEPPETV
jgi:hypothetical protein